MTDYYRVPTAATFDDAHKPKVEALIKEAKKIDVELIKHELKLQEPLYKKRAEVVKETPDFWFQALVNCPSTYVYLDDSDHEAMSYLSGFRVERDLDDPRAATVIFSFRENPFFTNTELVKEFTLTKDAKALEDDFSFVTETQPEKTEIDWKSDDKNLCKLKPTVGGRDSDDFEPGSFFSTFFESTEQEIAGGIGHGLVVEFWPNAIDFYTGNIDEGDDEGAFDFDSELDEEDEEDDDDAEEIDLEEEEKRPKKKNRSA